MLWITLVSNLCGKERNTFKDRSSYRVSRFLVSQLHSVDGVTGFFTFLDLGDRCTFDMFCGIWPVRRCWCDNGLRLWCYSIQLLAISPKKT